MIYEIHTINVVTLLINVLLDGGKNQRFVIFTPKIGEMIQIDEHIFQTGWFNHQLD